MRNVFSTALGMLILASLLGPIAAAKGGASPDDLRPRESMQLSDELWQGRPIFKLVKRYQPIRTLCYGDMLAPRQCGVLQV